MLEVQPQDSRGYYMLPQAPADAGYYVYGNVGKVPGTAHLAQYAQPNLLSLIFQIERAWQAIDGRRFGIGNISINGGKPYDKHKTHQLGIEMDCRPVRKDGMTGQDARCSHRDKVVYDRQATIKLIRLFIQHPWVRLVYFNDGEVQKALGAHVSSCVGHDDHFHVALLGAYA